MQMSLHQQQLDPKCADGQALDRKHHLAPREQQAVVGGKHEERHAGDALKALYLLGEARWLVCSGIMARQCQVARQRQGMVHDVDTI